MVPEVAWHIINKCEVLKRAKISQLRLCHIRKLTCHRLLITLHSVRYTYPGKWVRTLQATKNSIFVDQFDYNSWHIGGAIIFNKSEMLIFNSRHLFHKVNF